MAGATDQVKSNRPAISGRQGPANARCIMRPWSRPTSARPGHLSSI